MGRDPTLGETFFHGTAKRRTYQVEEDRDCFGLIRTELEKSGSPNAIVDPIALGEGDLGGVERLKLLLQADLTLYSSQDLKAIALAQMRSFG